MSPIWFGLQLWMTRIHELDAVIVNNAGKLRYHMQNIAVSYCMHNMEKTNVSFAYEVNSAEGSSTGMESVIAGLLGSRNVENIPEALDEVVKDSLRELNQTLQRIRSVEPLIPSMRLPDLKMVVLDINAATRSIDRIVLAASEGATNRVNGLLMLNVMRALVQVLWACITLSIVGNIWGHYYTAHMTLDLAQRRQMAMLNTMFDVVVPIGNGKEYQLLESDSKLDHLVGRSMQGKNILSCASDLDARIELQKLLQTARDSDASSKDADTALGCVSSWIRRSWWWNLVPSISDEKFPVAPMIRTTWCRQASSEDLQREMHLEVIATPYDDNSGTVLLGLRVIEPGLETEPSMASTSTRAEFFSYGTEIGGSDQSDTAPEASALACFVAADERLPVIPEAEGSLDSGSAISYVGRGSLRDARSGTSGGDTAMEGAMTASQYSGSESTPPPTVYGNAMHNVGANQLVAMAAAQSDATFAGQLSERLQALHEDTN